MAKFAGCVYTPIFLGVVMMISITVSADPDSAQDICVADKSTTAVKMNGFACKNDSKVSGADFSFSGLGKAGNASNTTDGSIVTTANVANIPGLNTLGISMSRIDYAPNGGVNPAHTHPRATEMVYVLSGELYVGFITTSNVLINATIKKGDVFVFPRGLLHFQRNVGNTTAAVISAFNSQLPGTQAVAAALFSAKTGVPDEVLARTFRTNTKTVDTIKAGFTK